MSASNANNQTPNHISFSLFCKRLSELCRTMATGTLYFVSPENRAGQFVLSDGQIVGVVYACQKGQKALMSLQSVTSVTYQFSQKAIRESQSQLLPTTQDILSQLYTYQIDKDEDEGNNNISFEEDKPAQQVQAAEKAVGVVDDGSSLPTKISISEQQRQDLERLTMNYLGPLAKLVVERLSRQANDAQILIQLLSQRIPDSEEAQTFREQAKQIFL